MRFISTRGAARPLSFTDVLLGALAEDGGLYMPQAWPQLAREVYSSQSFVATAQQVLAAFVGSDRYNADVTAVYAGFDAPEIAPLIELAPGLYLLELFHGPTLAFKDIALQLLARLTARELEQRKGRAVILVATFGDVFAGDAAMRMGLPVASFVAATNTNDILPRALQTGIYEPMAAHATLSPAMDIQIPSNFERALFEASVRDTAWLGSAMLSFAREARLAIPDAILDRLCALYRAESAMDDEVLSAIRDVHDRTGRVLDPHTAVALAASRRLEARGEIPTVVLATASPRKVPKTVALATGMVPPLPGRLRQSYVGTERYSVLPNDVQSLRVFLEKRAKR